MALPVVHVRPSAFSLSFVWSTVLEVFILHLDLTFVKAQQVPYKVQHFTFHGDRIGVKNGTDRHKLVTMRTFQECAISYPVNSPMVSDKSLPKDNLEVPMPAIFLIVDREH